MNQDAATPKDIARIQRAAEARRNYVRHLCERLREEARGAKLRECLLMAEAADQLEQLAGGAK